MAGKIDLKNINRKDWKKYRFEQIARSISERVEPADTDLEIYVGLEHIDAESVHIKRWGTPADVDGTKLRVYPGDVIFGKRRAYQRKAAVANFDGICSAHAMVLRANPDVIEPSLFPFFMHSDMFMHRAIDISVGSLSPTINWGTLKTQEFLLPPKDQQARIAELLWAADEVVQKYEGVYNSLTMAFEKIQQQYLFDEPEKNGNELKRLDQIAPLQRGFDLPDGNLVEGKYPVGYSNGVRKHHNTCMVKGPGVFTGRSGTIGNVFYVETDYWPHNTTLWVTDFKGNYPRYIYYLYSSLHFEKQSAGTGVPTLNRNDIHKMKVRHIEYGRQIEIVNILDGVQLKINALRNSLKQTKLIQKQLINQVFG